MSIDIPFKIGENATKSKIITDEDITAIANITGDFNPLHLDDEYAKKTRFKGRIAHGVLAIGLISSILGNQLPGHGTIYLSQSVKFLKPMHPGDTLIAVVTVQEIDYEKNIIGLSTDCFNQKNEKILKGMAKVLFENEKGYQL